MARTKAAEIKKFDDKSKKKSVKPAVTTTVEKAPRRWHSGTVAKRNVIKAQNTVHKAFIQTADGVNAVKASLAKLSGGTIDTVRHVRYTGEPLASDAYYNNPIATRGYHTTAAFKAAAVDFLQHAMVDITRAAKVFQIHRRFKSNPQKEDAGRGIKLLVADIKAVGTSPLLSSVYSPDIF